MILTSSILNIFHWIYSVDVTLLSTEVRDAAVCSTLGDTGYFICYIVVYVLTWKVFNKIIYRPTTPRNCTRHPAARWRVKLYSLLLRAVGGRHCRQSA